LLPSVPVIPVRLLERFSPGVLQALRFREEADAILRRVASGPGDEVDVNAKMYIVSVRRGGVAARGGGGGGGGDEGDDDEGDGDEGEYADDDADEYDELEEEDGGGGGGMARAQAQSAAAAAAAAADFFIRPAGGGGAGPGTGVERPVYYTSLRRMREFVLADELKWPGSNYVCWAFSAVLLQRLIFLRQPLQEIVGALGWDVARVPVTDPRTGVRLRKDASFMSTLVEVPLSGVNSDFDTGDTGKASAGRDDAAAAAPSGGAAASTGALRCWFLAWVSVVHFGCLDAILIDLLRRGEGVLAETMHRVRERRELVGMWGTSTAAGAGHAVLNALRLFASQRLLPSISTRWLPRVVPDDEARTLARNFSLFVDAAYADGTEPRVYDLLTGAGHGKLSFALFRRKSVKSVDVRPSADAFGVRVPHGVDLVFDPRNPAGSLQGKSADILAATNSRGQPVRAVLDLGYELVPGSVRTLNVERAVRWLLGDVFAGSIVDGNTSDRVLLTSRGPPDEYRWLALPLGAPYASLTCMGMAAVGLLSPYGCMVASPKAGGLLYDISLRGCISSLAAKGVARGFQGAATQARQEAAAAEGAGLLEEAAWLRAVSDAREAAADAALGSADVADATAQAAFELAATLPPTRAARADAVLADRIAAAAHMRHRRMKKPPPAAPAGGQR
jgi:hypothetical protein